MPRRRSESSLRADAGPDLRVPATIRRAIGESTLAARLRVSRRLVHEAVQVVQRIHVVTREPYAKAWGTSPTQAVATQLFKMRVAMKGLARWLADSKLKDENAVILFCGIDASPGAPVVDRVNALVGAQAAPDRCIEQEARGRGPITMRELNVPLDETSMKSEAMAHQTGRQR